jgi:pimeloyl-ACP methyl ester carboxylesterase
VSRDVIFYVNNGASLAPWEPSFLNTPPAPPGTAGSGSTSLVVPAADLIYDGTNYHALALVQAGTPAISTIGLDTIVTAANVDLQQSNKYASAPIPTLPVPEVLIHGLWGGLHSLQSTMQALQHRNVVTGTFVPDYFVQPICYSIYLRFDATKEAVQLDPNASKSDKSNACEVTSTTALDTYLRNFYTAIDTLGIIGGKVDAVVHSMGGLVVRHFATTANFTSLHTAMSASSVTLSPWIRLRLAPLSPEI